MEDENPIANLSITRRNHPDQSVSTFPRIYGQNRTHHIDPTAIQAPTEQVALLVVIPEITAITILFETTKNNADAHIPNLITTVAVIHPYPGIHRGNYHHRLCRVFPPGAVQR